MVSGPASLSATTPLSSAGWVLSSAAARGHPAVRNVPALVPNDIADDLERANLLPDLFVGLNSMNSSKWVMERDWTLTRAFSTPAEPATSYWIAFDGVDYNCSVRLNDQPLGTHVGAFEPFELEATAALLPPGSDRDNTLELTLHAPQRWIVDQLYPPHQPPTPPRVVESPRARAARSGRPPTAEPPCTTNISGCPCYNEGVDQCRLNRELLPSCDCIYVITVEL